MATTLLLLITGEQLELDGSIEAVAKTLENAARSGAGTLAWLTETAAQKPLGVYPSQAVTLRPGEE